MVTQPQKHALRELHGQSPAPPSTPEHSSEYRMVATCEIPGYQAKHPALRVLPHIVQSKKAIDSPNADHVYILPDCCNANDSTASSTPSTLVLGTAGGVVGGGGGATRLYGLDPRTHISRRATRRCRSPGRGRFSPRYCERPVRIRNHFGTFLR